MDSLANRIRCAVCGRKVASVETSRDMLRQGTNIAVSCHGEQREMFLSDAFLVDAKRILKIEAFGEKKLTYWEIRR